MSEAIIIEKPDSISFEMIHDLIHLAHKDNRDKGVVVSTTKLDASGIENYIGADGKCYVALVDGKLAGTLSYRIVQASRWYHKGKALDLVLAAVNPEYQGLHIFSMLYNRIMEDATDLGYTIVTLDTQEANETMRKISEKRDFHYVDYYRSSHNTRHYCVKMAKWISMQPFSNQYINARFRMKRSYVRLYEFFKK